MSEPQDTTAPVPQPQRYVPPPAPKVRELAWSDVTESFRAGWRDFLAKPVYGLFFGGIYALGGLLILAFLFLVDASWMIIFVAVGFPLIGPFVAVGLYEVSRRRAAGEPLSWRAVLVTVFRQRERQLAWMAFVVLFIFWMWIYQVRILLAIFLGLKPFSSLDAFLEVALTTQEGILFLVVGTCIGAVLALVLFSATVISMPLLLDRDVDFITAMIASFRTVITNPAVMISWGALVAVLAILSLMPMFLGLLVILPVLGHATWHLYTRAIEPPA